MTLCFIESQWICHIPCRIQYENASRTGVRILPNLTYISLRWKCCIRIEMHRSFRGFALWTPTRGFATGPLPGPLSGPLDPTPQGSRELRASIFCTLRKRFLINRAPNHPLPTGTREQSYATAERGVTEPRRGLLTTRQSFMYWGQSPFSDL